MRLVGPDGGRAGALEKSGGLSVRSGLRGRGCSTVDSWAESGELKGKPKKERGPSGSEDIMRADLLLSRLGAGV